MSSETVAASGYSIRTLHTYDDFEAIQQQEAEILGLDEKDVFPAKLMMVASETGGAVVGCFDPAGKLVGFVVNFPGYRYGRIIEWSYLISILPSLRGRGLERRLKWAQREAALARGVSMICWGFDPLDAGAARRNLHELGAVCSEYLLDFPDPMSGPVYGRFSADRLIARWRLEDAAVKARINATPRETEIPEGSRLVNPLPARYDPPSPNEIDLDRRDVFLTLPVPVDIPALRRDSPGAVERWLSLVRCVFQHYFKIGYTAEDFTFRQDEPPGWGWYVLRKTGISE
jgi:predicted GNAT superfamily acetyltransferase